MNFVVETREIRRFPVAAVAALRKETVVERLDGAIRHAAAEIDERLAEAAQGIHNAFALVRWPIIDMGKRHDAPTPGVFRNGRVLWNR